MSELKIISGYIREAATVRQSLILAFPPHPGPDLPASRTPYSSCEQQVPVLPSWIADLTLKTLAQSCNNINTFLALISSLKQRIAKVWDVCPLQGSTVRCIVWCLSITMLQVLYANSCILLNHRECGGGESNKGALGPYRNSDPKTANHAGVKEEEVVCLTGAGDGFQKWGH